MKNRAMLAIQMGALELQPKPVLGEYFHRMKARMGTPKAMTKSAHMLARILYHMVTNQQEYDALGLGREKHPRTRWQARRQTMSRRPQWLPNCCMLGEVAKS